MKRRRTDPQQLTIAWEKPDPVPSTPVAAPENHPPAPQSLAPDPVASAPLVQVLQWDFRATFPLPTDEALEAGLLSEDDLHPDNLRALHEQHARQALLHLRELDAVLDARRRGVDPTTGKAPRTRAARERLAKLFDDEPARLERAYAAVIGVYQDAFGEMAAHAFEQAIRAWHVGIEVVTEAAQAVGQRVPVPCESPRVGASTRRVSSRLPVPKPLPASIDAGRFGYEEDGRPVRPDADEVRAITERHAERVVELLGQLRRPHVAQDEIGRMQCDYARLISTYAEDFGEHAARQLEAYALRQHSLAESGMR